MKYNFYKKRMIFRILMYLILYGVFFVWFLFYSFKDRGSFNFFAFMAYSALTISFITTAVMIVSLILEIIAKKGGRHIFTIVQLIIAIAVNVILWRDIHGHSDIIAVYLYPAFNFIVWICWGIEFARRELK